MTAPRSSEGTAPDDKRTHLEMRSPAELRPAKAPFPGTGTERVFACPPALYRHLYREVGRAHHWVDRLEWTDAQIAERLAGPEVAVHLLTVEGRPAGYFELERTADGAVELSYLGLLPEFHGRGLGKYLLTRAVEEAWALGAVRVWLHTTSQDAPAALPNYLARGFKVFKVEPIAPA